jgi:predicted N-formylglutamate amidohydrolase
VIDCNRDPEAPDAIPEMSDGTLIPANQGLSRLDRQARIDAIHRPYQQRIGELIASREAGGIETILVSLHSFTPALGDGNARPWQVGVLHWRGDTAFAKRLLQVLAEPGDLVVGDNQPYQMDGIDHSVPLHAFDRGLPYAELEIRQDLIGDSAGQQVWAVRIAEALRSAAT